MLKSLLLKSCCITAGLLAPLGVANAQVDIDIGGTIRLDTAIKTTSQENPFNQRGNIFQGVEVQRCAQVVGADGCLLQIPTTRGGEKADNEFNYGVVRGDVTASITFNSNLSAKIGMRGVYAPDLYDEFDPNSVGSNAAGYLYGQPNYFEYDDFDTGGSLNPLEIAGQDYMIDFPELYFNYQNGPLQIRAGNQTIAWGQALFFRVLDVPNGLDTRRHLILDYAPEEFADERVPALGIRAGYQINQDWDFDGFVQKFQPSILPNPNTPYNVIASQFSIRDQYRNGYDWELNYGGRLRGKVGDLDVQFVYANRMNPDGLYRWTESGINRDLALAPGTGGLLADTPFEVDPTGTQSGHEWFYYAGQARLNAISGLNSSITEFPAAGLLGGVPAGDAQEALDELDLFFTLSGSGLRGHLAREYDREQNFGIGGTYVVPGKPGSLLDQLIINVELLYTPDRMFTNTSLSSTYLEKDELISAVVLEKYHRFSESFPATYFVAQWMHRTESDLYGRNLGGMNGNVDRAAIGDTGGSDYFVLAIQQPSPTLTWRADLAVLYDKRGGILVQPAIRWKPNSEVAVEVYYNYLNGGKGNRDIIKTIDHADELGIRIGYNF